MYEPDYVPCQSEQILWGNNNDKEINWKYDLVVFIIN